MPDTTRRVAVTLVAATDEDAHQVMAGVLDAVRNRLPGLAIDYATNSAFDLAENDEPDALAYLVIADEMVQAATVDLDAASSAASLCQGVVAELPLTLDYRRKEGCDG